MSQQGIGELGEQFVARCLEQNGWIILAQRWRCRWGELDIVAHAPEPTNQLIFVEVKVRGKGSWDQSGLCAISQKKRQKLILAAQSFLADYDDFSSCHCRFDVALLTYDEQTDEKKPCESLQMDSQGVGLTTLQASLKPLIDTVSDAQGASVDDRKISFTIQHYIQGAFDAE